jgi:hypothetical protein
VGNKWVATAAVTAALALASAGHASAAGKPDISPAGWEYVGQFGNSVICPMLDDNHTFAGVDETMYHVRTDGFSPYEAAGIVVASVLNYCTRNWPLVFDYATHGLDDAVSVVSGNTAYDPATLIRLQLSETG